MSSALIAHIKTYIPLSEAEEQKICGYIQPSLIKKKEFLLQEGHICRNIYFVEKGCLRMFFINKKGTEQTTQFAIENWWLADYMSFGRQGPSQFYIQAIEKTELVALDQHAQQELLKEVPKLESYFRLMLQYAYAASQLRIKYLYDYSREESYHHFINSYPGFVQRIPQYMLASYLNLTPEYLSEIRKKKA